jgi:YD repeat-containing protein
VVPFDTSNTQDAFGRSTEDMLVSGLTVSSTYGPNDWFGPSSVIEADGSTTEYTYTPLEQVASEIDYAYGTYPVEYQYVYDAAGNVVSVTQSPASSSGPNGTGVGKIKRAKSNGTGTF